MMAAIRIGRRCSKCARDCQSSTRLIGIALGAEDYVTNMKTRRHPDGQNYSLLVA